MAESYLLDTNAWISVFHGNPIVKTRFGAIAKERIFLSPITYSELLESTLYINRERSLENLYLLGDVFTSLPITNATAQRYVNIRADILSNGKKMWKLHTWVAAQALEHKLTLVTPNPEEYAIIPGIKLANWFD